MKNIIFSLFLFVILIKISFIFIPGLKIDIDTYQAWAGRLLELGPSNFYSPDYFSDYFPGYLYLLWFLAFIFKSIFPLLSFDSFQFEVLLKIVNLSFDLATTLLVFKIVQNYHKIWAYISALLYLSNPALTFNTSIWGQTDSIFTFFTLLGFYYLLELKKTNLWSFFISLAVLIKPQTLSSLPPLLILFLRNYSLTKIIPSWILVLILIIIIPLPFFLSNPIFGLFDQLKSSTNQYPYGSINAFNFWSSFSNWKSDETLFLFSYKIWGIILFLASVLSLLFLLSKVPKNKLTVFTYYAVAITILAYFLFLTRMHERYLYPFFAFLTISIGLWKSKTLIVINVIMSILHFLNLYYVYFYYNHVFNNSSFNGNLFYSIISRSDRLISLLSIMIFGYLLFDYTKKALQTNNENKRLKSSSP